MRSFSLIAILSVFSLLQLSCNREEALFQKMLPGKTGIDFSNQITESEGYNVMEFEYIYNGGGTAVGDFNNDGLQDLFFTGSMVNN